MHNRPVRREELLIKSYDIDCMGTLKLQSLLGYFQEIAGNQATELGVGYQELRQQGLLWVLSRIRIDITAMPAWRTPVSLTTWPKGVEKLFALRDFRMVDARQNSLLTATSAWLVLDGENNRPQRLDVLPVDIRHYDAEHAIADSLEKLKPGQPPSFRYEHPIMVSDLDVNDHVNNAEYIKWIVDCFGPDQMRTHVVRSIQINYLDEALFGDTIAVHVAEESGDEKKLFVEGISRNRGSKVFQASLILRPLEPAADRQ